MNVAQSLLIPVAGPGPLLDDKADPIGPADSSTGSADGRKAPVQRWSRGPLVEWRVDRDAAWLLHLSRCSRDRRYSRPAYPSETPESL